jgi:tetratricopeptide (TPR) repeat protein
LELAVAHRRVGEIFQSQGKLIEAQAEFEAALALNERLSKQDPINADWQLELAVVYRRAGEIFQTQGKLTEAQMALEAASAIDRRLAEQEPKSPGGHRH